MLLIRSIFEAFKLQFENVMIVILLSGFFLGEIQLAPYRAVDVKGLLENVAQITGSYTKGNIEIFFLFSGPSFLQNTITGSSVGYLAVHLLRELPRVVP